MNHATMIHSTRLTGKGKGTIHPEGRWRQRVGHSKAAPSPQAWRRPTAGALRVVRRGTPREAHGGRARKAQDQVPSRHDIPRRPRALSLSRPPSQRARSGWRAARGCLHRCEVCAKRAAWTSNDNNRGQHGASKRARRMFSPGRGKRKRQKRGKNKKGQARSEPSYS